MSSSNDNVSNAVFQLYKEFIDRHFDEIHKCNRRVEDKLDALIASLEAEKKQRDERRFSVKHGILIAAISATCGFLFNWLKP